MGASELTLDRYRRAWYKTLLEFYDPKQLIVPLIAQFFAAAGLRWLW